MTEVSIRFLGDIRALSRLNFLIKRFGQPADIVLTFALMFVGTKRANAGGGESGSEDGS
jgi:hypothetical protein